ncbi:MAG TPA: DUF3052 family protein [Flavisolibacter sp.]|jgi:hypothetical protein|nr:DUF3052 family protein [Flavisolibacter sp.]
MMKSGAKPLFYLLSVMPFTAGYSATPLAKKLGIKEGFIVRLINDPPGYFQLFYDWPDHVTVSQEKKSKKNFIHLFTTAEDELVAQLPHLKSEIVDNGMIWVSWPKKAAKIQTDITEDIIRHHALATGLVDVKVCAVDAVWSGLKLVIPVAERKK